MNKENMIRLPKLIQKEFSEVKPTIEEYSSLMDESYKYHNKLISEIDEYIELEWDPGVIPALMKRTRTIEKLKKEFSNFKDFPDNFQMDEDFEFFFTKKSRELHEKLAQSNRERLDPSSHMIKEKAEEILGNNHFSKLDLFEWNLDAIDLTDHIQAAQERIRKASPLESTKINYWEQQFDLDAVPHFPNFKAHFKAEQLGTFMGPWDNKFFDVLSYKCGFPEYFSHVNLIYISQLAGTVHGLDPFLFLETSHYSGDPSIQVLMCGMLDSLNTECMKHSSVMEPFSNSFLFLKILKLNYPQRKTVRYSYRFN